MKKSLFLLVLPLCAGAFLLATPRTGKVVAQSLPDAPVVSNQAELNALGLQLPSTDFDLAGHAFANNEARLFWNTNLKDAKRVAAREGKPILMLRLLGNLSDEYSCANSRFFRVVFYPQSAINARLRRDFVLCWTSERPVPVVTIDMGDGRKLRRTLTGNSVHYLLDSSGRPLDVFPGLSTPQAFETWLRNGQKLAQDFGSQPEPQRAAFLAKWHEAQLRRTTEALSGGPSRLAQSQFKTALADVALENPAPAPAVPARVAGTLARGKGGIETPLLSGLGFGRADSVRAQPTPVIQHQQPFLDAATRARIQAMTGPSRGVQTVASDKTNAQDALLAIFEANLLSDTRRGQLMSRPIHALFARGHEGDLPSLNRRIYDRLFLTPRSDEWLGLRSETVFSALQNDGIERPNNDVRMAQSR